MLHLNKNSAAELARVSALKSVKNGLARVGSQRASNCPNRELRRRLIRSWGYYSLIYIFGIGKNQIYSIKNDEKK